MGFFKTDVELIEPKKQTKNTTDKIKVKSLNGYDAIREKLEDSNTLTVCGGHAGPPAKAGGQSPAPVQSGGPAGS